MSKLRKKLAPMEEQEALTRWAENKPVRLAGFAAAIGLSYDAARKITLEPGFPKVGQWIFREDFEAWRREQVKAAARAAAQESMTKMPDQSAPSKRAGRPSSRAGKSGGSSARHDSPSAWPPRAARLLERAG